MSTFDEAVAAAVAAPGRPLCEHEAEWDRENQGSLGDICQFCDVAYSLRVALPVLLTPLREWASDWEADAAAGIVWSQHQCAETLRTALDAIESPS